MSEEKTINMQAGELLGAYQLKIITKEEVRVALGFTKEPREGDTYE